MVTIYILKDPITNEIRYCGQTSKKLDSRLKRHVNLSRAKKGKLTHKESWIRGLKSLIPIIEKIDECHDSESDMLEIYYIKKLREEGHNLTNTSLGGKGAVFKKENHPNWGKHLSEETKMKIGVANRGEKTECIRTGYHSRKSERKN